MAIVAAYAEPRDAASGRLATSYVNNLTSGIMIDLAAGRVGEGVHQLKVLLTEAFLSDTVADCFSIG
jgi:hypothetical protein